MFKKGEIIVYGSSEKCEIIDISDKSIGKIKRKYYILKTLSTEGNTIFVPVDNENLVSRMRYEHTKEDLISIIERTKGKSVEWIENTNDRSRAFKNIIASGNVENIVVLFRTLCERKKEFASAQKMVPKSDERIYRETLATLVKEFSTVMEIADEEVVRLIMNYPS